MNTCGQAEVECADCHARRKVGTLVGGRCPDCSGVTAAKDRWELAADHHNFIVWRHRRFTSVNVRARETGVHVKGRMPEWEVTTWVGSMDRCVPGTRVVTLKKDELYRGDVVKFLVGWLVEHPEGTDCTVGAKEVVTAWAE